MPSLGMLTEVHCRCPPVVAAARFIVRRRDSGHGDAARGEADLVEQFEAQARLGPLGIGRTIVVDTEQTVDVRGLATMRSEEHTSELQSLMRISYAVFCLKQ